MKIDWKNALVTVVIAYVGITLINKFVVPLLPASVRNFVS